MEHKNFDSFLRENQLKAPPAPSFELANILNRIPAESSILELLMFSVKAKEFWVSMTVASCLALSIGMSYLQHNPLDEHLSQTSSLYSEDLAANTTQYLDFEN